MKILNAEQLHAWDQHTIKTEPISSIDLMERAAKRVCEQIKTTHPISQHFLIICGTGNNGGDGLAIARLLWSLGYQIEVYYLNINNQFSENFKTNLTRIEHILYPKQLNNTNHKLELERHSIIIDCIFGIGLSKPIEGYIKKLVEDINNKPNKIIAIDIPSGLHPDTQTTSTVISADLTYTFQVPKLTLMYPENGNIVGEVHILDIGLDHKFIESISSNTYYTTFEVVNNFLKRRNKFDHKGNYGHCLIVSGSYGKMGACQLSSIACLKTGTGLLTALIPSIGMDIMQTAVPEAMCITIEDFDAKNSHQYNAIGIGPGLGQDKGIKSLISDLFLNNPQLPFVIDADAINLIAKHDDLIKNIPKNSILTPHLKEFERLVGSCLTHQERIEKALAFSEQHQVYIILKGAHSAVTFPNGQVHFNSSGNPGMATAGSGDTLCGILTSLVGQGYNTKTACILGTYLHGLAGDIAAQKVGADSLIASDIINNLNKALQSFN